MGEGLKRAFAAAKATRRRRRPDEKLVDDLVQIALDVLHHDRTDGSAIDNYERLTLGTKFGERLRRYEASHG